MSTNFDPTRIEKKRKDSFESETSSTFGITSSTTSSPANGLSTTVHSKSDIDSPSSSSVANNYNNGEDDLESISTGIYFHTHIKFPLK